MATLGPWNEDKNPHLQWGQTLSDSNLLNQMPFIEPHTGF